MNRQQLPGTVLALVISCAVLLGGGQAGAGSVVGTYNIGQSGSECQTAEFADAGCLSRSENYGIGNTCSRPVKVICPLMNKYYDEPGYDTVAGKFEVYLYARSDVDKFYCTLFGNMTALGDAYSAWTLQTYGQGSQPGQSLVWDNGFYAPVNGGYRSALSCVIPRYDSSKGYSHLAGYRYQYTRVTKP